MSNPLITGDPQGIGRETLTRMGDQSSIYTQITFRIGTTMCHVHGDVAKGFGYAMAGWRELQKNKAMYPDRQVFNLSVFKYNPLGDTPAVTAKSTFGQDTVIVGPFPDLIPVPGEADQRKAYPTRPVPAIIAYIKEEADNFLEIGFITGHGGGLQAPYRLHKVPAYNARSWLDKEWTYTLNLWSMGQWRRITYGLYKCSQAHLEEYYNNSISEAWPVYKHIDLEPGLITGKFMREIPWAGNCAYELPDWEKVNPETGWEGVPYPYGSSEEEDWIYFTGNMEYIDVGFGPPCGQVAGGGSSYPYGDDQAVHHVLYTREAIYFGGEVYHSGLCLQDKVTPATLDSFPGGTGSFQRASSGEGFAGFGGGGIGGGSWYLFYNLTDITYTACNNVGQVHPDNWGKFVDEFPGEGGDDWSRCFPPDFPEEYADRPPAYNNIGWWYEIDHNIYPDGLGGLFLYAERACTTPAASGGWVYSGYMFDYVRHWGTYYGTNSKDYGGAYYAQIFMRDRLTKFSRELTDDFCNWPFGYTEILKNCECYHTYPGCDIYNPCPWEISGQTELDRDEMGWNAHLVALGHSFNLGAHYGQAAILNPDGCHPRVYYHGDSMYFTGACDYVDGSGDTYKVFHYIDDESSIYDEVEFPTEEMDVRINYGTPTKLRYPVSVVPGVTYQGQEVYIIGPTRLVDVGSWFWRSTGEETEIWERVLDF